ncbi:LOW QUALITY PROTEIN: beta-xylosidase, partial [Streptomyces sp. e14]
MGWGFTHTQFSADQGSPAAVDRVKGLLGKDGSLPQNQAIMGWGADNPEPVEGRYDFAALDRRIDFMRSSGATPVITLCCAPDWMKGGRAGVDSTDWSQAALETAPTPDHYADYAALAATVAERYPDVRHFIVWNEFKGFWNDGASRWDYEGYTKLYNLVYRALKRVDPQIMVGGPYLVMDSLDPRQKDNASTALRGDWGALDQRVLDAFAYWNAHKAGADFVVVDGSSYTKDDDLLPDEFAATEKFTAVGRWVRQQTHGLPLWWAEYYVEPADGNDDRKGWTEQRRVAVPGRRGLIAMAEGRRHPPGFYWNPGGGEGAPTAPGLPVDAHRRRGRRPRPAHVRPGLPLRPLLPAGHPLRDGRRRPGRRARRPRPGEREDGPRGQHAKPPGQRPDRRPPLRAEGVRGEVARPV